MKKLISYFITYPVAVNTLILGVAILGVIGMFNMRSSFFPLQDSKFINITVAYPGASPEEMEEGVVLKIENNLKGLLGVDRFTSSSSENSASISVEAEKGYDIDVLLADVKNAVDKVPSFPTEMEPPVVAKQETLTEAISMVITGEGVDLATLKNMAREVETDLRNLEGISQVEISGFPDEEISIDLNEETMRAYGLSFAEVSNAVASSNILVTGGTVKTDEEEYLIRVRNRGYYAQALEQIIVRMDSDGRTVRLSDIAAIRDTWSETPERGYFNGTPSVAIQVRTTNNEDMISAAQQTLAYIEEFNAENQNLRLEVTRDSSVTIIQRTELLLKNGLQGVALVLLFLSLFLRPRLAAWVAFGLPVSFLGMFMFVNSMDVTINVLSLFGMIIVIGILVDDGIVIAENIFYHYESLGKSRIKAAIDGTMEVMPAIFSAILTTMIAFSTFFFLDGRIGEFFGEVTIVVMLTLGFSLFEAFIILPSHVGHSKALTKEQKRFVFNVWGDNAMDWMRNRIYMPLLRKALEYKPISLAIMVALLMMSFAAMQGGIIRSTFFPVVASDRVSVTLKMPQGVNPEVTDSLISIVEAKAWETNEEYSARQTDSLQVIENIRKQIGPGTANASLFINLLPGEERDFSASEIANAIFEKVGTFPNAESLVIDGGSNFGGSPVAVSLLSNNISELKAAKLELKEILEANPLLRDIGDNDPAGIKEIELHLTDKAYSLGLGLSDVIGQVRAAFNGQQVQRFQRGEDEIIVWVRYEREGRSEIEDLDQMRILTPSGDRIPLSELASYSIGRGDVTINHLDGKREIRVDADLKNPKEGASAIVQEIKDVHMPYLKAKYPSISALYEGQNREAAKTQTSAQKTFPIILLLIYIVIAFTFRSFSQPLILIVMIPFAFIGVGWGHWIHDFPVNMLSMLGIIALIGIVVNDGLVFIAKFNSFLKEGLSYEDALLRAGESRFRAIFLTSITTIAGLSPLIFETSRQAQFLIPMAISIAYGIGIATVLTLIMLPLLLSLSNQLKVHVLWLWEGKRPSRESVERAIQEISAEKEAQDNE
ncbi:MAG: efflux RND transporter permease subunit [Flavobacteriales bacterium]|nr:efflux RND transporter permease subunit [Flavobacteriales bacterium]